MYCEEDLNLKSKRPKWHRSAAKRKFTEGNSSSLHQCWSMDFVSDHLYDGTRLRALTIVDNYSWKCLAIYAGKSLKGSDAVQVMENVTFDNKQAPQRIKVDSGSKFISK